MPSSEDLLLNEAQFANDWCVTLQLMEVCGWMLNATQMSHTTGQTLYHFRKEGSMINVAKNAIGLRTLQKCMEIQAERAAHEVNAMEQFGTRPFVIYKNGIVGAPEHIDAAR